MNPIRITGAMALTLLLVACGGESPAPASADKAQAARNGKDETPAGEHGGRLLEQDGYRVELALVEDEEGATWQAWLYRGGATLPSGAGTVKVRVTRLDGRSETFVLQRRHDGRLVSAATVAEPHSFDVDVNADIGGKSMSWRFDNYAGRTKIVAETAREAGIRIAAAAPGTIADEHEVQGLLTPVEGREAKITARFPGPVRALRANIGDRVRAGQALATIESNLSLTTYTVTSPIDGVVLARTAAVGESVGEGGVLFEVADLSRLWVDLHIFGADSQHIQPGVPVTVTRMSDGASVTTRIERVLPNTATASQSTVARAALDNADGLWRPGSAVTARITVAQQPAAVVVPLTALQSLDGKDVVFMRAGDTFEAQPVKLGKRDAKRVEVLEGLRAGAQVVTEQSYLVKADVEKAGASHEH